MARIQIIVFTFIIGSQLRLPTANLNGALGMAGCTHSEQPGKRTALANRQRACSRGIGVSAFWGSRKHGPRCSYVEKLQDQLFCC